MKQILLIIGLSIFVVLVSQVIGMTSARADLALSPTTTMARLQTLVLRAALEGDLKTLKMQIAAKADLNVQDEKGETALMKAIANDHQAVVAELLKNKVNINAQDKAGNTALLYAVSNGSVSTVKALLKGKANLQITYGENQENILFETARNDNAEIAQLLVKAEASLLKSLSKNQENALFEAARIGAAKISRYLISQGMSARIKNSEGKTALQIAQENNLDATVLELQKSK